MAPVTASRPDREAPRGPPKASSKPSRDSQEPLPRDPEKPLRGLLPTTHAGRATFMSISTASRIFGSPVLETRRAVDMDKKRLLPREANFDPYPLRLGLWAPPPQKPKTLWIWI